MRSKQHIPVPFFWSVFSGVLMAGLVYLLSRNIWLSAMVGLTDIGCNALIRVLYLKRKNPAFSKPVVIWFTGLPGAGKTTLGNALAGMLKKKGLLVEHLDGDEIRECFPNTGFSREDRDIHIRRVGYMASRLEANGVFVIASFVSPYKDSREFARFCCKRFVEIHVSTPLHVCEKRDPKGLYLRARQGEIQQFTGISDVYEIPESPELRLDTSELSVNAAIKKIMDYLSGTDQEGKKIS